MANVLVAGAGGFIGGHMVDRLTRDGHDVRSVDHRPLGDWHQVHSESDNKVLDLRVREDCDSAVGGMEVVYNHRRACDGEALHHRHQKGGNASLLSR